MTKIHLLIQSPSTDSLNISMQKKCLYELHINKEARKKYLVSESLFESTGNIVFPNYRSVRELTSAINKQRAIPGKSETLLRAGTLNAIGLLDEICHFLVRLYDEHENPQSVQRAYKFAEQAVGKKAFEKTLSSFLNEFPPIDVYKARISVEEYVETTVSGRSAKEIALEELMMLSLANLNPAFIPVKELFDDSALVQSTDYQKIMRSLEDFFRKEKPFGPDNQTLLESLKKPFREHPDNIGAQLQYFKEKWGIILSLKFLDRIAGNIEFSKEEDDFLWRSMHPGGGTGTETFVPQYKRKLTQAELEQLRLKGMIRPEDYIYDEPEQFTPDIDWMPNVVLIAKNTYVWLDQLSKKYHRSIRKLNEIPDEELDRLRSWNFTGLWLIGVWERSNASKRIKQINGNNDAVSSAYSLYEYEIAWDLGGEEAFQNLNRRAWERGIRLAGDMVPNHMGIYSKWVVEHPEYFIQSDVPPYPSYQFTGPDLSEDPNIEIRIEDGYWRKSDAAVVFQRVDKRYNDVRYMYHGNDGTNMPWNDTAQLNMLRADVREAVIQNILHVARKFSVIRFDAAMTLAKKHFQRLWYPLPGTSGVPSRQDCGMSRSEFDTMFPVEFWREVVDRFNREMPQTLLLAEAFWLMEGYFVRTLGMHRVYNSAFMHMLMKEENSKYRSLIKNTLEFNPEILKRYVNFMSNPDEETAVAQFGKDDKYFGVLTMMLTLPGLPMFGHGQIEGYAEKYGMEYQRAYYNENEDHWLVQRHEHEAFPLMQKRYLFSQVEHFELYDFQDDRGFVNEDVFAYSNMVGNERALIFFHNKYSEARGWIRFSVPKIRSENGRVRTSTLGNSLGVQYSEHMFYRCRDRKSNLEYLLNGKEIHDRGIRTELHAFHYIVMTDFSEMYDDTGIYAEVTRTLNGAGAADIDRMLQRVRLRSLFESLRHFANSAAAQKLDETVSAYEHAVEEYSQKILHVSVDPIAKEHFTQYFVSTVRYFDSAAGHFVSKSERRFGIVFCLTYRLLADLNEIDAQHRDGSSSDSFFDGNDLYTVSFDMLSGFHLSEEVMWNHVQLLRILLLHRKQIMEKVTHISAIVNGIFDSYDSANFLGVNEHKDVWYFNKEQFTLVIEMILSLQFIGTSAGIQDTAIYQAEKEVRKTLIERCTIAASKSVYRVEKLKEILSQPTILTQQKNIHPKVRKEPKKPIKKG